MSATAADIAAHWDRVYDRRATDAVSWYQEVPERSLRLLTKAVPPLGHIVDVGAGASGLATNLVTRGYRVTLVDVSHRVLEFDRQRLKDDVTYVEADLLQWEPGEQFEGWHDRAFFHFLVDPNDQARYVELANQTITHGGALVMGVFAPDGPTSCSGLPVRGHDAQELAELFSAGFALETSERETHTTPSGADQPFTWVVLRREARGST